MDNKGLSPEETRILSEKFDIMLQELKSWGKRFEEKFLNVDSKLSSSINRIENKIAKLDADNEITHKQIFESLSRIDNTLADLNTSNQEEHKKLFENIAHIDKRITALKSNNEDEHKKLFENVEHIDRRITALKSNNEDDHSKFSKHLDSINSAFIRYETDGTDKIKILFDSDVDRKNHQDIYGHEFKRLNDLVAKNSFRISNLEQHFNQI